MYALNCLLRDSDISLSRVADVRRLLNLLDVQASARISVNWRSQRHFVIIILVPFILLSTTSLILPVVSCCN